MKILVTGGAGYIGSHVVKQLLDDTDFDIIVVDNYSTGFSETIDTLKKLDVTKKRVDFYNVDLSNHTQLEKIFISNNINYIIHFAAFSQVSESMINPSKYYRNNTANTIYLVDLSLKYKVKKFIFSSTAAVYGEPSRENIPMVEELKKDPINPYGKSKLFTENIIKESLDNNSKCKYVILRYFNVAGADSDGYLGENHNPETHLIPLVAKTALGKRKYISIFGNDYDTEDGTCVRDYLHIKDLANAHLKSLEFLDNNESDIFNCGYGCGYSVLDIVNTMKKVSGVDFKVNIEARREGDPAILIADSSKIKNEMGWLPKFDDLEFICKSALDWESSKEKNLF